MRVRTIVAAAVAAALAAPALAQAQPNRHHVDASVAPGKVLNLTFGTVPQGEFHFGLRVSSDGSKDFRLTQKRDNGTRFLVLGGPNVPAGACQGAAGSLFCTNVSTPATPAGHSWNFRFRNRSNRPMTVALTVVWKRVTSAG